MIGHRGMAARAPENSLGGFAACAALGLPFELDVALSADGVPVVIHDDTLDRTTTGAGPVGQATAAELGLLGNAKGWGPRWEGERLPTLRQVLDQTAGGVWIDVELKSPPGRGDRAPLVEAVLAALDAAGCADHVFVSSFDPYVLGALAARRPQIPRGLLVGTFAGAGLPLHERLALRHLALVGLARPDLLIAEDALLDAALVRRWRRAGYGVLAWTVNAPARARALCAWGVHGVITDDPGLMAAALGVAQAHESAD
ncbi:MAG: glycerophosphodiester phosphodiesterase [Deltaproteobacteria bacterium]|nr:glycerophosphodiester phosphodiesterase [Deltaproteobacteria bacterium]